MYTGTGKHARRTRRIRCAITADRRSLPAPSSSFPPRRHRRTPPFLRPAPRDGHQLWILHADTLGAAPQPCLARRNSEELLTHDAQLPAIHKPGASSLSLSLSSRKGQLAPKPALHREPRCGQRNGQVDAGEWPACNCKHQASPVGPSCSTFCAEASCLAHLTLELDAGGRVRRLRSGEDAGVAQTNAYQAKIPGSLGEEPSIDARILKGRAGARACFRRARPPRAAFHGPGCCCDLNHAAVERFIPMAHDVVVAGSTCGVTACRPCGVCGGDFSISL